ncbi:MAG: hypothetical protein HOV81_08070 [Kofleriaceae bacterium]|nr:hypothetical protein [Kofleriaceae bacterium]
MRREVIVAVLLATACRSSTPTSSTAEREPSATERGPSLRPSERRAAKPPTELAFPRIATYFIESHVDDKAREVMAKSDVSVVDAEAGALDRASLDQIRAARPDGWLLAYLTSEEISREPAAERPLAERRYARVPPHAWLTEPGSALVAPVTATATTLHVQDGKAFRVTRPRSDFYGAAEPTYVLVDGEHMKLRAIHGNTLEVERGVRSVAVPHAAGTRVASHVVFFAGTWMLNIAADAPAVNGRTWREELADEAARLVAEGPWNGVFLDVCFADISWLNAGLLDLDRDGVADRRHEVSKQWSKGMGMLVDAVRARVGPSTPIVANPGAQDCPHGKLDGILLEGWPTGLPPTYLDFATGEARYEKWAARDHHLTIANAFSPKIGFRTIDQGQDEVARTDYRAMRFGLTVALMADGLYTFDNGVFGHYVAWWYDEYDGAGRGVHWLGRARGPAKTVGALRWREFDHGLAVVNRGEKAAMFAAPPGFAKLAGTQDPKHNDGQPVTEPLRVAAGDGYVLVRVPTVRDRR